MSKVVLLTTSPTAGGNGDALIGAAADAARAEGAGVVRIDTRELEIGPCLACGSCKVTGACAIADDFGSLLDEVRAADGIVVSAPIYFNLPNAQSVALLNRFFSLFGPATVPGEPNKKLAVLLTFGGSDPDQMSAQAEGAVSFFPQVAERRIETFPQLSSGPDACASKPEYLDRARSVGAWAAVPVRA